MYNWENKKLLIVDDVEMNYILLSEILNDTNINITWCEDGKDSVELLKNESFDIILMDVKMPIMDGLTATKIIKKINSEIPIIIQSAFAMETDKIEAFKAGCDDYISKPIKFETLIETIYKYMRKDQ